MLSIIPLDYKHLDQVIEIENKTFVEPWSKISFEKEIENINSYYIVKIIDDKVVGYAGIWYVFDEGHLMNIAVDKEYRGLGIGKEMVQNLIDKSQEIGLVGLSLEVRKSNKVAISLYESLNFVEVGIRKDYYMHPKEDGIIMWNYF